MKKIYTIVAGLLLTVNAFAQAPQKMSYQSVIRNSSNALITSTAVGIKVSILQGSSTGTAVYSETQTPTTNANGLVSLQIGTGTIITGTFSGINWANGPYFIKTETDPIGGTNYTIAGTSELLSVPYALFSANSTPGVKGDKGDTGAAGAKGDKGDTGTSGTNGAAGATGAKGDKGDTGTSGTNGAAGATGAKGDKGDTGTSGTNGAAGATGAKGDKGDKGDTGTAGTNGAAGATGAKGDKGDTGATGPAGGSLSVQVINTSTILTGTNDLFIVATGTITITLPSAPATGQKIYIMPDSNPTNININPNGKQFRQGGVDYSTSKLSDFGVPAAFTAGLTLIYSGTKWYPVSTN